MTDRIASLTVVLDREYRDDDCQSIIDAIQMTKGVLKVTPEVVDIGHYTAKEQARMDLRQKIFNVFKDD